MRPYIVIFGLLLASSGHAAPFQPAHCDMPGAAVSNSRMDCGTVHVSRDPAQPGGPTFALAVAVIHPTDGPAQPDPVL